MSKIERSIEELYNNDPERADAVVFGRRPDVNRRGFLGGAGLAAMGATIGGAIPFSQNMPAGWDDSLSWMTKKHGMHPIEGEDRKIILDYLEQHYPPATRPRGRDSPNPFLK